jgi:succinyl-CoA synthetase alpha subunit
MPPRHGVDDVKTACKVIPSLYRDSVALMAIAAAVSARQGVQTASLVMATEANLSMLHEAGLLDDAPDAGPNDLLTVVSGEDGPAVKAALAEAVAALDRPVAAASPGAPSFRPHGIAAAVEADSSANLALISTPGEYAAAEAMKALRLGLDVMLFSDNVALADEIMLKRLAGERGLMVMGPDCGTAIIDGMPLGFANAVRRGDIGIVAASGTGLQEVACRIDRLGGGISQAIGCGGRDLTVAVGATTMLLAIDKLAADPETAVIVMVSKPPEREIAERVLARASEIGKPVVVDFLGMPPEAIERPGVQAAVTLAEAASMAVALASGSAPEPMVELQFDDPGNALAKRKYLRGLFGGGTLCYEALVLLRKRLGTVHSETPLDPADALADPWTSQGHTVIDLGSKTFTRGRAHPMIDLRLRNDRILSEAEDPEAAVILLDVVLGHGAHPDPGPEIAVAIGEARRRAAGEIAFVASVCGTEADPQVRSLQQAALRDAGVLVADSNAEAVLRAASILLRG